MKLCCEVVLRIGGVVRRIGGGRAVPVWTDLLVGIMDLRRFFSMQSANVLHGRTLMALIC